MGSHMGITSFDNRQIDQLDLITDANCIYSGMLMFYESILLSKQYFFIEPLCFQMNVTYQI